MRAPQRATAPGPTAAVFLLSDPPRVQARVWRRIDRPLSAWSHEGDEVAVVRVECLGDTMIELGEPTAVVSGQCCQVHVADLQVADGRCPSNEQARARPLTWARAPQREPATPAPLAPRHTIRGPVSGSARGRPRHRTAAGDDTGPRSI